MTFIPYAPTATNTHVLGTQRRQNLFISEVASQNNLTLVDACSYVKRNPRHASWRETDEVSFLEGASTTSYTGNIDILIRKEEP